MQFNALLDREQEDDPPYGKALDIGCGTGDHAVNLAQRGWHVTAVDNVPRALASARTKSVQAGVDVRYVQADVTDMAAQVGSGFSLLLDVGTFHGLKPQRRLPYLQQVEAVSHPGSTLLMLAFQPGRRPPAPLPRGASRQELEDYVRAVQANGETLTATGTVLHAGRRTARTAAAGTVAPNIAPTTTGGGLLATRPLQHRLTAGVDRPTGQHLDQGLWLCLSNATRAVGRRSTTIGTAGGSAPQATSRSRPTPICNLFIPAPSPHSTCAPGTTNPAVPA